MKSNSSSAKSGTGGSLFDKFQGRAKELIFITIYIAFGGFMLLNTEAASGNDLVITDLSMVPASPSAGQKVEFTATIKNQGNSATKTAETPGVGFFINGELVAWNRDIKKAIQPGQSITVTANGGQDGGTWAATPGKHSLSVVADDLNVVTNELDESNNSREYNFKVGKSGRIYPSPAKYEVVGGKEFVLEVRLQPGTSVQGYELDLEYDKSKLELVQIDASSSPFSTQVSRESKPGSISLVRGVLGENVDFDSPIAKVTFKALASDGGTPIQITGNAASDGAYTNPSTQDALVNFKSP